MIYTHNVVYVDMDDTICEYSAYHAKQLAVDRMIVDPSLEVHEWFPQSQKGFFRSIPPIPGAIKAVKALANEFDLYFLTAPSVKNPHSYSEKREWIENYFGLEMCHKLIICPNKGLCEGRYLIDDITRGKGQEHFKGELIHFGSDKFPDWDTVLKYLLKT